MSVPAPQHRRILVIDQYGPTFGDAVRAPVDAALADAGSSLRLPSGACGYLSLAFCSLINQHMRKSLGVLSVDEVDSLVRVLGDPSTLVPALIACSLELSAAQSSGECDLLTVIDGYGWLSAMNISGAMRRGAVPNAAFVRNVQCGTSEWQWAPSPEGFPASERPYIEEEAPFRAGEPLAGFVELPDCDGSASPRLLSIAAWAASALCTPGTPVVCDLSGHFAVCVPVVIAGEAPQRVVLALDTTVEEGFSGKPHLDAVMSACCWKTATATASAVASP